MRFTWSLSVALVQQSESQHIERLLRRTCFRDRRMGGDWKTLYSYIVGCGECDVQRALQIDGLHGGRHHFRAVDRKSGTAQAEIGRVHEANGTCHRSSGFLRGRIGWADVNAQ